MTLHTHKEKPRSWERDLRATFEEAELYNESAHPEDKIPNLLFDKTSHLIVSLLSTREKEVREEFLKKLPEEKIVHDYINLPDEVMNNDMRNGWNSYRMEVIKRLTSKTEIR